MKKINGEVSDTSKIRVKFHPNRYHYAEKFKNYLDQMEVKIVTVERVLVQHGVPRETVKSFFSGKHIPSGYLVTLITEIWGYRFHHKDFEEVQNG
jgi:hypothetical protein